MTVWCGHHLEEKRTRKKYVHAILENFLWFPLKNFWAARRSVCENVFHAWEGIMIGEGVGGIWRKFQCHWFLRASLRKSEGVLLGGVSLAPDPRGRGSPSPSALSCTSQAQLPMVSCLWVVICDRILEDAKPLKNNCTKLNEAGIGFLNYLKDLLIEDRPLGPRLLWLSSLDLGAKSGSSGAWTDAPQCPHLHGKITTCPAMWGPARTEWVRPFTCLRIQYNRV